MFWAGKLPGHVEQQAKRCCICLCHSLIIFEEDIVRCAASQAIVLKTFQISKDNTVIPLLLLLLLLALLQ